MLHQNVYKFIKCQNLKTEFCVLLSNTAQVFISKAHYSASPPHSKVGSSLESL